jgi:hypothetical protein
MKKNKLFIVGMLALTFALVLAACVSGPNPFPQMFGTANAPGTTEFRTRYNNDGNLIIVKYLGRSEAVVIPAEFEGIPVVAIGAEAFSGNRTMKSVAIPDSVTIIEKDAFDGCAALADITIPAPVIRIGTNGNDSEDVFDGCTGLTGITVAGDNGVYSSEDGVLFNKDKTALLLYPEGKSGSYTIPSSVTSIAYCAFESCGKLTDVTIPDSVTSIGEWSFLDCTGLTSITIPGSIKTITGDVRNGNGYGAFFGCTGLTSVTISQGVTSIGGSAFARCTRLASVAIPDSVTSIGQMAFQESGLTSVTIPDSVTYIGYNAFAACTRLTSVTVSPVNGRTWDNPGDIRGAFVNCSLLSPASREALRRAGDRSF